MTETLVKAENISKKFCKSLKRSLWYGMKDLGNELTGRLIHEKQLRVDEFWAVKDVSFELKRGECLGLIGRNGAGKSTLLKMLGGLIKPDGGRIEMRGRVGSLIELGAGFNPILTGRENIYINGSVLGFTKAEIDRKFEEIIEFAEVGDFIDSPVQNYSSGMKVRLGFAIAAQLNPDILLIDEVLAVGDIPFRLKCINKIIQLIENSATIFVSHSMQQIAKTSTCAAHMQNGHMSIYSTEVNKVIDHYFSGFTGSEPRTSGSRKIKISDITLTANGEMSKSPDKPLIISHGDELCLEMKIHFLSDIKRAEIQIGIYTMEMHPVAEVQSALSNFYVENKETVESLVQVIIPNIPFNSGLHSVTIIILDDKSCQDECFLRVDNVAVFQVKNITRCWAYSLLNAKWTQLC